MSLYFLDGVSDIEEPVTLAWNVLNYVDSGSTLELQWNVYNNAEELLELRWAVLEVLFDTSVELQWNVYNFAEDVELQLLWNIFEYEDPEYHFKTDKRIKSFM